MDIPEPLIKKINFNFELNLPNEKEIKLDSTLPTLLFNYYNIDPNWRANEKTNKLLIFEPLGIDFGPGTLPERPQTSFWMRF